MILYWIDDKYDKTSRRTPTGASKRIIEQALSVDLKIELITNHSEFGELIARISSKETYGVLMDYQLTNVGEQHTVEYGTTWAAQLRGLKPSIPIIGLSAEDEKVIPKFRLENFLAFFKRKDLLGASPSVAAELKALFEGYHLIWSKWKKVKGGRELDALMKLLLVPRPVAELLRVAIPSQLRGNWDDETPHSAARWIWHQLQGTAGFLFDEIEAATYLGITQSAFGKFKANQFFADALYQGALSCNQRPRWWICKMRGAAELIVGQPLIGPVSHSRDELLSALGVPKKDRSSMLAVPHGRKGSGIAPECVTFPDQNSKNEGLLQKRVAALLRDTIVDEADANPPFGFEAKRHFKLDADA